MARRLTDRDGFWRRLLAPPDALMLELGAGGELLVAKLRAVLSLAILPMPLVNMLTSKAAPFEVIAGVVGVILTAVVAQLWLALARRARGYRWLPWVTTAWDITLTTAVLAYLSAHSPAAGLNSMVVWVFYLVALALTALRNDARLSLFTGLLAMLQYGLLALVVLATASSPERLLSLDYGTASVGTVLQRLLLLAAMTAVTTTIVFRMQRLVELSGTDGLTGLPNRTLLIHRFPAEVQLASTGRRSLSVCLIDLDYFKRINDDFGHLAGDRALRHVVGVVRGELTDGDWLARLGGEEFALLMAAPAGRAWERMEAIRRAVASTPFAPEPGGDPMRLTFSAGIASWPQAGSDLSELLRRADARLRQAKQDGRNRVVARDA